MQIKSATEPSENVERELRVLDEWFLKQSAPKVFDSTNPKNVILEQEKAFDETCNVLEELGTPNPETLTVYKFYSKIRYLKNKPKPKTNA